MNKKEKSVYIALTYVKVYLEAQLSVIRKQLKTMDKEKEAE